MYILNIHRPLESMGNPPMFRGCGNMKINPFSSSVFNIEEKYETIEIQGLAEELQYARKVLEGYFSTK